MTNHKKIDAQEVEAFLILKYGDVEKAMMAWLDSDIDFTEDEEKMLAGYAKLYWPNLNLVRWRDWGWQHRRKYATVRLVKRLPTDKQGN